MSQRFLWVSLLHYNCMGQAVVTLLFLAVWIDQMSIQIRQIKLNFVLVCGRAESGFPHPSLFLGFCLCVHKDALCVCTGLNCSSCLCASLMTALSPRPRTSIFSSSLSIITQQRGLHGCHLCLTPGWRHTYPHTHWSCRSSHQHAVLSDMSPVSS